MRIIKKPEVRKSEILDTAEMLFITKGYNQTTIIDILDKIGIAKGTFYYYFKSKEEVMDAVIVRIVDADVAAAKEIAERTDISALNKIYQMLMAQRPKKGGSKEQMIEQFHQTDNAQMHQKSLVQSILHLAPVFTEVIKQGISENVFKTDYPQETMEFLIAASTFIFDEGLFDWQPDEVLQRAKAFVSIMETTLGAEKDSLKPIYKMLIGQL
jgi:AcrR family transcriptional regulator